MMDRERHHLQNRLIDAVTGIDRRRMYGRKLSAVVELVLEHHQPEACWSPFTESYSRWECTGHLGSDEEQHTWPCDEVEALAKLLDVPL